MTDYNRRHRRLPFEGAIFIELEAEGVGNEQAAKIVKCKTLDVSQGGLRVGINREITVGAILQIGVELVGEENTLYLIGEVIWCDRDDRGETLWQIGFKLMNASDSDIDIWIELLNNMS